MSEDCNGCNGPLNMNGHITINMSLQESLTQRSSILVYCLPLVLKLRRTGDLWLGRKRTLMTCLPVHSLIG